MTETEFHVWIGEYPTVIETGCNRAVIQTLNPKGGKMVQWVETFVTKLDNMSSIPDIATQWDRENWPHSVVFYLPYICHSVHPSPLIILWTIRCILNSIFFLLFPASTWRQPHLPEDLCRVRMDGISWRREKSRGEKDYTTQAHSSSSTPDCLPHIHLPLPGSHSVTQPLLIYLEDNFKYSRKGRLWINVSQTSGETLWSVW